MNKTYCGKSCDDCTQKHLKQCEGCNEGPGKKMSDTCELAQCCKKERCNTCQECTSNRYCKVYHSECTKEAPILSKWILMLFWVSIANIAVGFIDFIPGLETIGKIATLVCGLAYGAILLRLSSIHDNYQIAGICCLVTEALSIFDFEALIILIAILIISMVYQYNEFIAHSEVVKKLDYNLSAKWHDLWRYNIGLLISIFVGVFVALFMPGLGIIVIIAIGIAALVIGILKLMYLYQTAKLYKEITRY